MTDLAQLVGVKAAIFPPNSRYHGLAALTLEVRDSDGEKVTLAYLPRRFLPQPERLAVVQEHPVIQGDRLDNLAQTYFGDPELFWRLCDANEAMAPDLLTAVVGRRLRVTLPEDIPASR